MLLKQFVQEVREKIDLLPTSVHLTQEEKNRQAFSFSHALTKVKSLAESHPILQESEELFKQLIELLNRYVNSEETATHETLKPFTELLVHRWRKLKDQAASDYIVVCRQTLAHKAYVILAGKLELILNADSLVCENYVMPALRM